MILLRIWYYMQITGGNDSEITDVQGEKQNHMLVYLLGCECIRLPTDVITSDCKFSGLK
jgi:hypothetical protein